MKTEYIDYWQITYTDVFSGYRETYMNIGFESKESARRELDRILREVKKANQGLFPFNIRDAVNAGMHIPSIKKGTHWRIKKIKIKTDTPMYKKYLESKEELRKLNETRNYDL